MRVVSPPSLSADFVSESIAVLARSGGGASTARGIVL